MTATAERIDPGAGTERCRRIALEAAMFRSLVACVAENCRVHDGSGHSDSRIWRHRAEGVEEASEFDYRFLANALVRGVQLSRGEDPNGRLKMFERPVAEILADLARTWPISTDGPHAISDHRRWLARQLMDSKNSDEEAFGIVAHAPGITDAAK